jgi:hypothetical protein
MFSSMAQASGQCKTGEKQVAMIAQKVCDANQTHGQRSPFIAFADA